MAISLLPRRFHGNPLPNFTIRRVGEWRKKMPRQLRQLLQTYQQTGQRFLLFVPSVADLDTVLTMVHHGTPDMAIASTHATDSERQAKVQAMRDESLQALITTTILERGVTFPGIDVIILGADDAVFSQAALIQFKLLGVVGVVAADHSVTLRHLFKKKRKHFWQHAVR